MNMTDEEIIAYWRGAYDRMAARSIEDGARITKLEADNDRMRKALEPFAEAGSMALTSGRPPGEHVDAAKFLDAVSALEGK